MVGGMAEPNIPAEATARLRANEPVLLGGGHAGRRRPALLPGAPPCVPAAGQARPGGGPSQATLATGAALAAGAADPAPPAEARHPALGGPRRAGPPAPPAPPAGP